MTRGVQNFFFCLLCLFDRKPDFFFLRKTACAGDSPNPLRMGGVGDFHW